MEGWEVWVGGRLVVEGTVYGRDVDVYGVATGMVLSSQVL